MGITVHLTPSDELRAAMVGFKRQANAVERGYAPRHRGGSLWGGHIEGACAELAGSIATGLPWTGEQVWRDPPSVRVPDLGTATEVRWVAPTAHLLLNYDAERDRDERYYMLVSGHAPTFEVHGFVRGIEARRDEWRVKYPERTVYRVPVSALHPLRPREAAA